MNYRQELQRLDEIDKKCLWAMVLLDIVTLLILIF